MYVYKIVAADEWSKRFKVLVKTQLSIHMPDFL